MKIDELEDLSGQPRRNIRFLISENVIPEPNGVGRSATYDETHLAALKTYSEMKAAGIGSLEIIKNKIRAGASGEAEKIEITPAPGISVSIEKRVLEESDIGTIVGAVTNALLNEFNRTRKKS